MALVVELAPLRVNQLSPGVVETAGWDFMAEADRKAFFAGQEQTLPTRYVGTPSDIADAAIMLMTNRYVTGTVLHVDSSGRLA
jgi:NAD(P)-dependent dehydrogenase (short-subunit alcohol dehydrogenase family)